MNWTRRKFLGASAIAPAVTPPAFDFVGAIEAAAQPPSANPFGSDERNALLAAMDEIIPASDGMPAASEVNGLEYLTRVAAANAEVAGDLKKCLAGLNTCSQQLFEMHFDRLNRKQRISALEKYEVGAPQDFAKLRDYIYESYYTQPAIWKLIGYELYPTDHQGPHMEPFDESILAGVRKRLKLYREA